MVLGLAIPRRGDWSSKSTRFFDLGTYVFVLDPSGVELVNGAFPELEGKNQIPVVWTLGTTAPEYAHDIHQLLS